MYREIEIKYDVPLNMSEEKILEKFTWLLVEEKFTRTKCEKVNRTYTYFDTRDWLIYQRGETIRQVEGFNKNWNGKGKFRYDYKKGTLAERYEKNIWRNERLTTSQILEELGLAKIYRSIQEVAIVDTVHHKATFVKGKITLEAKVDYFCVRGGGRFKEIEVELAKDSAKQYQKALEDIGQRILKQQLGLEQMHKQKYARVLEMREKNSTGVLPVTNFVEI